MKRLTHEKICVVGLGYIGLPTSAMLANHGYTVHGVDVRSDVIEKINRGQVHIQEPGLEAFVQSAVHANRLRADLKPTQADVFIIAVPTPFKPGFVPDLDYVNAAAKSIAPYLRPGNLVILESTVPVGATDQMAEQLSAAGVDVSKLHIAFCPERVLPGRIMKEFLENDRVVGGRTPAATAAVKDFYESFITGSVFGTDARTAEMVKLTENSFRDVNIAFANELSMICSEADIDVNELISLANRHPRVKILSPGCGVGGHCIAVDPWFIVNSHPEQAGLIRTARQRNLQKTEWVLKQIADTTKRFAKEKGRQPTIACMGLAFKPDVDDLRESPALEITEHLIKDGYQVLAVEPNVETIEGIPLTRPEVAFESADILVYLVAHSPFKKTRPQQAKEWLLDYCGVLSTPPAK